MLMNVNPVTLFRALADDTRLRCLALIAAEDELCVCELTHALDLVQPKISRHLASLREAGVVDDRRAGQWIHYRLHPQLPAWARRVLDETLTAMRRQPPHTEDRARLKAMTDRPGARCA